MSENENPVEGFWIVSETSGEVYDSGHTFPVGIFTSEEAADSYISAYNQADRLVMLSEHRTINWHSWSKRFVPKVSATPAIVTVYEYETERDEETGKRYLTNVNAHHVDLNSVSPDGVYGKAVLNPDRAYREYVNPDGETEILDSEVFPAMVLASSKDYYEGGYETFYTVDPDKIILDPPADYVHPAPIPWTPQVKGKDGLYDWERELLTGSTEEKEPVEVEVEKPKNKPLEEWEVQALNGTLEPYVPKQVKVEPSESEAGEDTKKFPLEDWEIEVLQKD